MIRRFVITTCVAVTVARVCLGGAQDNTGIKPLTEITLAEAVKAGETPGAYINAAYFSDPLTVITSGRVGGPDPTDNRIRRFREAPYSIQILSPYVRVMLGSAEAKRKYEPRPAWSIAEQNGLGVVISVAPGGNFANAGTIEDVVIQRDGAIVRPKANVIQNITLQNLMGAKTDAKGGAFAFDVGVFEPTSMITIALIGPSNNFEFSLTSAELSRLR